MKLPDILTFSLSRFDFDYNTFERVKINSEFTFTHEIQSNHLMEESDQIYELYSVIIHSGSAHGGHYHCYIKDLFRDKEWYDFNDQNVTQIPVEKLESQFGGKSENAYILIYTLKEQKVEEIQTQQYIKQYIQKQEETLERERVEYQDLLDSVQIEILVDNYFLDFDELILNAFGEITKTQVQVNLVKNKEMILSLFEEHQFLLEI